MMKKYIYLMLMGIMALTTSCFENYEERYLFTDQRIEFQEAVVRNNAPGRDYPLLPTQALGEAGYQVNMFGEQLPQPVNLEFRVDAEASNAIEGVHYTLPNDNFFEIEANSSFGEVLVERLEFDEEEDQIVLVLELVGNEQVEASYNHKRIGVVLN
ncbi:DUF4843 domain-containing protein [Litoribacter ruber]|uniref:DUF4843 domain-containing protein n=1 Tax=Litoribacter ruber TaxID=702568 RepID=A0AAP2G4J0_9BACT|nr:MULTISPECIES: DUF4843 domain-containing protein [Litoribacter]MBS9524555.1 DUF4843 domain-containing protein [Litoribacter alkaliphilus]MBT0810285.1 DUF4843 domain-containing protein [Litoribacter ruber]